MQDGQRAAPVAEGHVLEAQCAFDRSGRHGTRVVVALDRQVEHFEDACRADQALREISDIGGKTVHRVDGNDD